MKKKETEEIGYFVSLLNQSLKEVWHVFWNPGWELHRFSPSKSTLKGTKLSLLSIYVLALWSLTADVIAAAAYHLEAWEKSHCFISQTVFCWINNKSYAYSANKACSIALAVSWVIWSSFLQSFKSPWFSSLTLEN